MDTPAVWIAVGLGLCNALLLAWLLLRRPAVAPDDGSRADLLAAVHGGNERVERALRGEIADNARAARQELGASFASFQLSVVQQGNEAVRTQNAQLDAFAQALTLLQKTLSDTLSS